MNTTRIWRIILQGMHFLSGLFSFLANVDVCLASALQRWMKQILATGTPYWKRLIKVSQNSGTHLLLDQLSVLLLTCFIRSGQRVYFHGLIRLRTCQAILVCLRRFLVLTKSMFLFAALYLSADWLNPVYSSSPSSVLVWMGFWICLDRTLQTFPLGLAVKHISTPSEVVVHLPLYRPLGLATATS